jgi:hypothetical protein
MPFERASLFADWLYKMSRLLVLYGNAGMLVLCQIAHLSVVSELFQPVKLTAPVLCLVSQGYAAGGVEKDGLGKWEVFI